MAALTRLLPLSAAALCLWLAPRVFPGLPAVPSWLPLLVPLLAFWRRPQRLSGRVRTLDRAIGLEGLLCAAMEAPGEHPFAPALAARARAALAAKSRAVRAALFAPARYQRPRGLLVALLAFLLFLHLAGPLPVPGPRPGALPPPMQAEHPPEVGPGRGGPGSDPRSEPGSRETARQDPRKRPEEGTEEPEKEPRPDAPPLPPPPALLPGEPEKLALTPPPAGEGPRHMKPVYETEGLLPPPVRPGGLEPPAPAQDPVRLAVELERAAERALGDGLLTAGEAWLARRQAEAMGR